MITSNEVRLPSQEITAEKEALLRSLPSTDAFYQESTKVIGASTALPIDAVARTLATQLPSSSIDQLRLMNPGLDSASNMAKVRAVRAATVNQLVGDVALPSWPATEKAIGLLMTDQATRNSSRSVFINASKEYDQPRALNEDLSYLRAQGGEILAQRLNESKITRSRAVAIASALEQAGQSLSAIEKAQIINHLISTPEGLSIKLLGSRAEPAIVQNVIIEARLRDQVMNTALGFHPKPGDLNYVPLSHLAPVMNQVMDEFHKTRTVAGLKDLSSEIVKKEKMPDHIGDLRQAIQVIDNHPEIKAVSFDLYDTLVSWTSNQQERRIRMDQLTVNLLKQKYGFNVDYNNLAQLSAAAWNKRHDDFQSKGNEVKLPDTLGWILDPLLTQPDGQALRNKREAIIKDLEKTWYKVELDTAVVVPEALQALKELKARGVAVGLTSNASWTEQHLRRVLHRFRLLPYFDAISYSAEIGTMKDPNRPEFFHHSWKKLNARPDQVVHIGDQQIADVQGARNAGGKAIRYANPTACAVIEGIDLFKNPETYNNTALELHRQTQNRAALRDIEDRMERAKVPLVERERLRIMAQEVYQKSRDIVGPAYIALGDQLLDKLAKKEADLVLSLSRDGIPLAIVQKMLLSKDPDKYPGVTPEQIKYLYISRTLIGSINSDPTARAKYLEYLKSMGTDKANKILLTDIVCGQGTTHRNVEGLLEGKQVEGHYLDSWPEWNHLPNAHSFIKETTGNPAINLDTKGMLLFFEALFNGPFNSVLDITKTEKGVTVPVAEKKQMTPDVLTRGLSEESLKLLNRVALKALQDGVDNVSRKRSLGLPDRPANETIQRFYSFINTPPTGVWLDILRTLPWQDGNAWKTVFLLKDHEFLGPFLKPLFETS